MPRARRLVRGLFPRLHFVTPDVVERTIARAGVEGILTVRERSVFDAFALETRRRDWIAGRLAAKRAIRAAVHQAAGWAPSNDAVTVWNDESGRPRFTVAGRPELEREINLSLAHTNGTAIAAVARTTIDGTVGVDIEPVAPLGLDVVRRVMSAREIAALTTTAEVPDPLAIWTVKEAGLKAARHATVGLRDVELTWSTGKPLSARLVVADMPLHALAVHHRVLRGHAVAVVLCRAAA